MANDPSVYGSYMNFFLPPSAQVGGPSVVPTPGLFDMLGGMGLGGWGGSQSATPDDQKKRQQQQLAMAQMGMKMMQPPATPAAPADMPQQQPQQQAPPAMPPATMVMPSTPVAPPSGYPGAQAGGYPRQRLAPAPAYPFRGY